MAHRIKKLYKEEEKLIRHYNKHTGYSSTSGGGAIKRLGITPNKGDNVLDLGCGDGRLATALPQVNYLGVDFSTARIDKAKTNHPTREFICDDIYTFLECDERAYDFIFCFEVLEHLVDPKRAIALAKKRLKKDGVLAGSVPVNMGYVAHIQVFANEQEVEDKINPDSFFEESKHFWCKWKKDVPLVSMEVKKNDPPLAKVLYVYQSGQEQAQEHIINYLRENQCEVDPYLIPGSPTRHYESANWSAYHAPNNSRKVDVLDFNKEEFQNEHKDKYDFQICNIHVLTEMHRFQTHAPPKYGVIDMEHDGMGNGAIRSQKSIFGLAFQNRHYNHFKNQGLPTKKVRWYKLDANYPEKINASPFDDAIFIGSAYPALQRCFRKGEEFEHKHLFKNVWYKKFIASEDKIVKAGTKELPPYCDEAIGTKYCADMAKFWFTCMSGCYFDALVFGAIPIVYRFPGKWEVNDVDDVLSNIQYGQMKFVGITSENIDHKIKMLRNENRFKSTLTTLRAEFFDEDEYFSLPSAHETILNVIKKTIK